MVIYDIVYKCCNFRQANFVYLYATYRYCMCCHLYYINALCVCVSVLRTRWRTLPGHDTTASIYLGYIFVYKVANQRGIKSFLFIVSTYKWMTISIKSHIFLVPYNGYFGLSVLYMYMCCVLYYVCFVVYTISKYTNGKNVLLSTVFMVLRSAHWHYSFHGAHKHTLRINVKHKYYVLLFHSTFTRIFIPLNVYATRFIVWSTFIR